MYHVSTYIWFRSISISNGISNSKVPRDITHESCLSRSWQVSYTCGLYYLVLYNMQYKALFYLYLWQLSLSFCITEWLYDVYINWYIWYSSQPKFGLQFNNYYNNFDILYSIFNLWWNAHGWIYQLWYKFLIHATKRQRAVENK